MYYVNTDVFLATFQTFLYEHDFYSIYFNISINDIIY